jgi:Transglycosylase SLT domain
VRLLTVNRRARPAVVGGGLVAVCAVVAAVVAALSGGPPPSAGPLPAAATARATASAATAASASPTATAAASGDPSSSATLTGATTPRLIVPDVIASVPGGVTKADLARLRRLTGVRAVLAIDGAKITVNGRQLTVLAAAESALRPWTPPATASDAQVWSNFAAGDLITSAAADQAAGLASGGRYPVTAGIRTTLTVGAQAPAGISGVDGIVDASRGRKLGLVGNIAVLVNAPTSSPLTLVSQVKTALGGGATVIRLVPAEVSTSLPVDATPSSGRPSSYLQLFQESAAQYCPGLSWTVLAAIGQIESGDGQNEGPSTAGALGPMQFLPSTWQTWGTDGFGDTGAPNIMNPYDAVPSAARLLCADGAASGGQGLRNAIFDYNHASWYVNEVLTLAGEYAQEG